MSKLTPWHVFLKDFGETEGLLHVHVHVYLLVPIPLWVIVAGKEVMKTGGVRNFNKAASHTYTALTTEEKEKLLSRSQDSGHTSTLSRADIIAAGGKIFKKLRTQVKLTLQYNFVHISLCASISIMTDSSLQFTELEKIGYHAVAYGFFENDVQAAYTTTCTCCVTPQIVNYIHAVTIAGIIYR